jgi:hypothetical protein
MAIIVVQCLSFLLYSALLSWNAFIERVGFCGHRQAQAIGHIQVWSLLQSSLAGLLFKLVVAQAYSEYLGYLQQKYFN